MKLDEYVKQTLFDITNGVEQAQRESLLFISPEIVNGVVVSSPQMVSFEITVSVSKEAGGGIRVFSFGDLKAQGNSENVNKISFQVPIYFNAPTPLNPRHYTRQSSELDSSENP